MNKFNARRAAFRFGVSAAALAISLVAAVPAHAQTAGSIRGEGAQAGATVTVTDVVTGRSTTATVGPDGTFVIFGLRPSTYRVEGSGETRNVTVPVGQTVTIDAAPAPTPTAESGEEIIVQGRRDRTEVRTATVSTNVSQVQIENLPQNDRNFLNFAALAPGVTVSPSSGDRRIQAGAISGDNINVFIDGLSYKNPVNHGGVAGQNFSQGNPFPQLAVQEFKVDTQNFKAEYEQSGSAIITAVTKTGGTEFHGDVFGQFQPKAFIGRPFFDRPGEANNQGFPCPDDASQTCYNPKPDYERWQFGADLGGPIIKEKLHFFVAFEGTEQTNPSKSVDLRPPVPQSIRDEFNGSYPQTFSQRLYFGKLSLFATPDDTIDASAFVRKEENLRDFEGISVPEHGRLITSNVQVYQLEWDHRGENWLNEFTFAYNTVSNGAVRTGAGSEIVLAPLPVIGARAAELGTAGFAQNDEQKTLTLKDYVTVNRGDHVLKGGVRLTFNKYERTEDNQSNGAYYFNAATYGGFDATIPFAAQISTVPVRPASAKNTQFGLFIQDDWTPDEHWTVNLGLRWDYETNSKNENFVTPQRIADALRAYPGWQAAGIDPDDYISTGNNRKPYWKAFQPRLGVSYDVKGDRDIVLFAGAGRYFDRPLFITAGIETIKANYESISTITFCNGAGQTVPAPGGCIPWSDSYRDVESLRTAAIAQGFGGSVWLLNNKTKLPYSDQFNIGIRKRFGDWNTSLAVSHIRSHNIFKFVRGNRLPDGSFPTTSATGEYVIVDNFPDAGQLPGFRGKLNIGSNDGEARYWGFYAQADKPFTRESGWGASATLTLQNPRSNVGTELNGDEFFAGPDMTQFGWQDVQGVDKYRFVGTGIVNLPWDFRLSGTVTLASGPAFGNVRFYPDGIVFNGGGVFYPKKDIAYKSLDMRVAKTFRTPWGHEVTADFQVYNLFDWVNRAYSAWGAGSGLEPTFEENGVVGNARTFQAGLKYSF
ncbi:TonB-dependent receptor [Allosphingosinicella deserti]|uniref:TonB-dependent transporter Oar-like beta-barrel domain-containing protein n=1 Tax=Allosphingosinicella deserti TaxID=2116704 RepID=A0A2P7QFZ9_9SPHN|nr:TonB-dependent receptor [Sphingomonas deserti]PSJ36883.1 hypothetical protein C7I55_24555 [Sphingomonas deserti]